jgi:hypothetical protein
MKHSKSSSVVSSFVSVYSKKNNDTPLKITSASINIENEEDKMKKTSGLEITSNSRQPLIKVKQSNNKKSKIIYVEPKKMKKYLSNSMKLMKLKKTMKTMKTMKSKKTMKTMKL